MEHRSEPHPRMEDWLANLPASDVRGHMQLGTFLHLCTRTRTAQGRRGDAKDVGGRGQLRSGPGPRQCSSNPLLSRQDLDLLTPHDRRWIPFAGQCSGLRSIEAQAKVEGPFGRRKPVGLLFCTWALVLKI